MQRTLFLPGSLAANECRKILSSAQSGQIEVLELETYLPIELRPCGIPWANGLDYHGLDEQRQIDNKTDDLLDEFLQPDADDHPEIPLSREFRAACLGMACRKVINPYLVNLDIAGRFFAERPAFEQIIIAPGSGISFRAWRQIAAQHGLPLRFLQVEPRPWSISRRWQRLVQRLRTSPRLVSSIALPTPSDSDSICCASLRVARLLVGQTAFSWSYVSDSDFGPPTPGELDRLKSRYWAWWQQREYKLRLLFKDRPDDPRSILVDLGRQQSQEVYPLIAWKYLRAIQILEKKRPRLLVVDTQEGSQDLAWALAAQHLDIPVASYTYDHVVQPRFSLNPEWVLSDSGRQHHVAKSRGQSDDRIVGVASSRRPPSIRCKKAPIGKPRILFADSYYAGVSATVEPQRSQRHYQVIISTARQMPSCLFQIKFHPLRDRKKETQCFIGMDEDELYLRTRFIQSLRPPKNVQLIAPEQKIIRYIEQSSVVLNSNSTAGLEAFALGIPVLFLNEPNITTGYPLIYEYGACQLAAKPGALQIELHRLLSDPDLARELVFRQRRYIDEFYWPNGSQTLGQGIYSILSRLDTASQTIPTGTLEAGPNF
jgi:hypothetical protein